MQSTKRTIEVYRKNILSTPVSRVVGIFYYKKISVAIAMTFFAVEGWVNNRNMADAIFEGTNIDIERLEESAKRIKQAMRELASSK